MSVVNPHIADVNKTFLALCAAFGHDPKEIRGTNRKREIFRKRCAIARSLRGNGFSYPQIAGAMNRDHTSIINMVDVEFRKKRRAQYRKNVSHEANYPQQEGNN